MRGIIENYCFGVNVHLGKAMLSGVPLFNRITFFLIIILLHQLIYYSLIFFSFNFIDTIILYTLLNSIITFIVIWTITKIFYDIKR